MRRPRWTVVAAVAMAVTVFTGSAATAAPPAPEPNNVYWTGDNTLTYNAGWGRANVLTVTVGGVNGYQFDDTSKIIPGYGCYYPSADNTIVICFDAAPPGHVQSLHINLSSHDDTLSLLAGFNSYTYVDGGSGNDTLWFGAQSGPVVRAAGGTGNDYLIQLGTAYTRLDGGAGADGMCGAGDTYVSYANNTSRVTATLDGVVGNDGSAGEGDTLCPGITGVTGTPWDDYLMAGANPVWFSGEGGPDTLIGSPGNDHLTGGDGNDVILGQEGTDDCDVQPGDIVFSCET